MEKSISFFILIICQKLTGSCQLHFHLKCIDNRNVTTTCMWKQVITVTCDSRNCDKQYTIEIKQTHSSAEYICNQTKLLLQKDHDEENLIALKVPSPRPSLSFSHSLTSNNKASAKRKLNTISINKCKPICSRGLHWRLMVTHPPSASSFIPCCSLLYSDQPCREKKGKKENNKGKWWNKGNKYDLH